MRIFAIGDLHMSTGTPNKAMDVFGPAWQDHTARIADSWEHTVRSDDVVLVPGDISWATHLEDAQSDLEALGGLPGRKVLVRGNHDYWWSAPAKVRRVLPDTVQIIQNDAIKVDDMVFCGTRGWPFPMGSELSDHDRKIFEREKLRLRMSLERAKQLGGEHLIVLLHFPPLYENALRTDFVQILEEFGPDHVVFGHLHGKILDQVQMHEFQWNGIAYHLVSADYVGFAPVEIAAVPRKGEQTGT